MLTPLRTLPVGFIEPCLPSPADKPPSGANWIHEIKHDGFRLMARRDPVGIRLIPGGMTGGRAVLRQLSARAQEQQICEPIHRWFRKGETQQHEIDAAFTSLAETLADVAGEVRVSEAALGFRQIGNANWLLLLGHVFDNYFETAQAAAINRLPQPSRPLHVCQKFADIRESSGTPFLNCNRH
jgi:hypothetical protein